MEYTISESVTPDIEREISRIASSSYSEDGVSLYDSYKITTRDTDTLRMYMDEAYGDIVARMVDVASLTTTGISFYLPDFDSTMNDSVQSILDDFVANRVISSWLQEKGDVKSEIYTRKASSLLDKAHIILKSRKAPKRK